MMALALSLFGGGPAVAAESPQNTAEAAQKRPGLRFKSGPICMCSGGLSEADIRRAERERGGSQDDESKKRNDHEEE